MLEVGGVLSSFFLMIFEISFKLTLDIVNKDLEFSKVLLEESFKIRQCDKCGIFVAALILSLFKADNATKVLGGK